MKIPLNGRIKEKIDRGINRMIVDISEKYNYEISELYEKFSDDIKQIHEAIKNCNFNIEVKR